MASQQQANFALFMPYLGPNVSRRTRELQIAEVRAAAARSTHAPQRADSRQHTHRSRSPTKPIEHSEQFPVPSAAELQKSGDEVRLNSRQALLHASEDDRELVEYYIQSLLPEVFTMAAIVGISTLGQALFIWLLQDADFYAIGIAYLSLKVGDVAENYDRDLSLLRYEFIGRGILRLRQRIERSQGFADYTTLMATAYLAEIASLEVDAEAYEIHKASLNKMIRLRGGIDELNTGNVIKCAVVQMREDWELRDMRQGIEVPVASQSSTDWQLEQQQRDGSLEILQLLPAGFRKVGAITRLSEDCIRLILRVISAGSDPSKNVQNPSQASPNDYMTFEEVVPSVIALVRNPSENTFEQLLTASLLLFASIKLCPLRNQSMSLIGDKYAQFRRSLTMALHGLQLAELRKGSVLAANAQTIEHSLVWIFCITASSWAVDAAEPRAESVELLAQLRELISDLTCFDDLVPSLNDHCTTDFISGSLELCWTALETKNVLERAG